MSNHSKRTSEQVASKSAISLSENAVLPACKSYVEQRAKAETTAKQPQAAESQQAASTENCHQQANQTEEQPVSSPSSKRGGKANGRA